ncbi:MAG: PrsW family intramembrane metalloprotease [Propionibacteriaceae bacterium]
MAYCEETPESVERARRRRNGLPAPVGRPPRVWWRRPVLWATVASALVFSLCMYLQWRLFRPQLVDGRYTGFTPETVWLSTKYAAPTVIGWCIAFFLLDRWRPQRLLLPLFALGWGASVATFLSLHVNSWASAMLGAAGENEAAGASVGIYVAPFVEEAAKASVLFLVAILVRYRLTSKLSTVTLAGLSAAGFAFTENIIYYARAYMFASQNASAGDRMEALQSLFLLRGILTCWGHPFFTSMTGIGMAIALRTRSKSVRIVAPVTGYLVAAFCHMFFNAQASKNMDGAQMLKFFGIFALSFLIMAIVFAFTNWLQQGRLIRARLTDFVYMGWLPATDPVNFGSWRRRRKMLWLALWNRQWRATIRMIRAETELAYLRDGVVRGIIDDAADGRIRELFDEIRGLRSRAIADPTGVVRRRLFRRKPKATPQLIPAYVGTVAIPPASMQPMAASAPNTAQNGYASQVSTWH